VGSPVGLGHTARIYQRRRAP